MLISGRGSNMKAILDACNNNLIPATVEIVISNKKDAPGLALAQSYGVKSEFIDIKQYDSKQEYEAAKRKSYKSIR